MKRPGMKTVLVVYFLLVLLLAPISAQETRPFLQFLVDDERNLLPLITVGGSMLLLELGGVLSHMGFELEQQALYYWDAYIRGGAGSELLEKAYIARHYGYLSLEISSYAIWSAGASALSLSAFLLPPEVYRLSPEGRYFFTVGLGLCVLGNVFSFSSSTKAIDNQALWNTYVSTGGFSEELRIAYEEGYGKYALARLLSCALWTAGGAGMTGSFYIPGEKTQFSTTSLDRILVSAGVGMMAGGNVLRSAAVNAKRNAAAEWERYLAAGADDEDIHSDYKKQYRRYFTTALLAYGLWTGGGASILTAVYLPGTESRREEPEKPSKLSVYPTADGIGISIRY
jgi:hypothetical protein